MEMEEQPVTLTSLQCCYLLPTGIGIHIHIIHRCCACACSCLFSQAHDGASPVWRLRLIASAPSAGHAAQGAPTASQLEDIIYPQDMVTRRLGENNDTLFSLDQADVEVLIDR